MIILNETITITCIPFTHAGSWECVEMKEVREGRRQSYACLSPCGIKPRESLGLFNFTTKGRKAFKDSLRWLKPTQNDPAINASAK